MRIIRLIASCLVAGVAAVATAQTTPVRLRGATWWRWSCNGAGGFDRSTLG